MDLYNEFIFLCYQVNNVLGGNLIDSDFDRKSHIDFQKTSLKKLEIQERLLDLKRKIELTNEIDIISKIYIYKHVDALIMQLRLLDETVDFIEAVSVLYDINAEIPNHDEISKLHEEIDQLLFKAGYKQGSLKEKLSLWSNNNSINAKEFINLANDKCKEYSSIVAKRFSRIIDFSQVDDKLELKIVSTDQGWAAYNYYLDNYNGIIEFNKDATFNKYSLENFISHEGYPGHHTSCIIKEYLYRNGRANPLVTLNLLNTPSSLIEEGIGESGLKILGISENNINYQIEILLDQLSAEAYYYADYLYYYEYADDKTILNSLINDKLHSDINSAQRAFAFIKKWGYYIPTYKYGRKIVGEFLDKNNYNYLELLYGNCCKTILENWEDLYEVHSNQGRIE